MTTKSAKYISNLVKFLDQGTAPIPIITLHIQNIMVEMQNELRSEMNPYHFPEDPRHLHFAATQDDRTIMRNTSRFDTPWDEAAIDMFDRIFFSTIRARVEQSLESEYHGLVDQLDSFRNSTRRR